MDTKKYAKLLEEERAKLEEELLNISIKNPKIEGDWIPIANPNSDRSAGSEDQVVKDYQSNIVLTEILEARYQDILKAIKKIKNGTYGICEVTDKKISEERLDANPAARTCKDHLEKDLGVN